MTTILENIARKGCHNSVLKTSPFNSKGCLVAIFLRDICSRAFTLATGRRSSLPSIGRKGRVPVRMEWKRKKTLQTRLGPNCKPSKELLEEERDVINIMETCSKTLVIKLASKNMLEKIQCKWSKRQIYLLWVEMGHHGLALRAPLKWNGSFGSMEKWRRWRVNG